MNIETVSLNSFQKQHLQSILILLRFVHPWLVLYLLCYLNVLSLFEVLILSSAVFGGQFSQSELA